MPNEIVGNIWDFHAEGKPIGITTNGLVKANGECVMGRGTALQAKQKYPKLPIELGLRIKQDGNRVFYFPQYNLVTFPVKHNWWEKADLALIQKSAEELLQGLILGEYGGSKHIYLPKPGCGNGQLRWESVRPIFEKLFTSDYLTIIDKQ